MAKFGKRFLLKKKRPTLKALSPKYTQDYPYSYDYSPDDGCALLITSNGDNFVTSDGFDFCVKAG